MLYMADETDIFNKAKIFKQLIEEKGMRVSELAKKFSIKPSYVCHILRLNRIPDMIIDGYYSKQIFLSHLFIISRIKNKEKLINAYEKILEKNLTISQTEELVREILYDIKTEGEKLNKEVAIQFINELKSHGIETKVIQTRIKSKLVLEIKGSLKRTTHILKKIILLIEAGDY